MLPPELNRLRSKVIDPNDYVIQLHHEFMTEYGWISLSEFRKLPITTFLNLWDRIIEERVRKERERKHARFKKRT